MEIGTAIGPGLAEIDDVARPRFWLVLTHGAGGGVASPDLLAARQAGLDVGAIVARVLQPYRAAGRRVPGSPARQDAAWLEIVAAIGALVPGIPLVQGGRSNGARLACRTARQAGAAGVVALAFPLHPPGRAGTGPSRAPELRAAGVPVLAVSGDRDPFGIPDSADVDRLIVLPGEAHPLSRDPQAVRTAVTEWLGLLAVGFGAATAGTGD